MNTPRRETFERSGRDEDRSWLGEAIRRIEADQHRSADTHLLKIDLRLPGIDIYLKDESTHPTGSLKHRLARSLFLYALCNGHICAQTAVVEASSGSTAVSEAYFAQLIGVPFYAVMPRSTSCEKIAAIEQYGGKCHLIDDGRMMYSEAAALADRLGGYYMDQFTYAERATDWRGNNNIAESIFEQMAREPRPIPAWMVMSAGTGGTSATLGRYLRYKRYDTRLCVADVENSAFFDGYCRNNPQWQCDKPSLIEGVGRPRVEPSFIPGVIDHMIKIPDCASLAATHVLSRRLGRRVGGSTGTNFFALLLLAAEMLRDGREGSLVTLICDSGERYSKTYFEESWLRMKGIDTAEFEKQLEGFLSGGRLLEMPTAAIQRAV